MIKKLTISLLIFLAYFSIGDNLVKADTVTANNMVPVLRTMYHVDEAEAILNSKVVALKEAKERNASEFEIATAKAAVTDATNLLNTLNAMITRDVTLMSKAPAGVVNPPTFATNSFAATGAWNDFIYKEKINHVMAFPSSRIPTAAEVSFASKAFSMF